MDLDGHWGGKVWAYNNCFAWRERWNKHRSVLVQVTACALNCLAILVIGQTMHYKCP
jgi:hypothetical protein